MRQRRPARPVKRRTTLTLPADSLAKLEKIARQRHVTLSAAAADVLADGFRVHPTPERSRQIIEAYKKAFAGLTDDEVAILDGVILEPKSR